MTPKFIYVSGNFYLRANNTLRVEDLFARKKRSPDTQIRFFSVDVELICESAPSLIHSRCGAIPPPLFAAAREDAFPPF